MFYNAKVDDKKVRDDTSAFYRRLRMKDTSCKKTPSKIRQMTLPPLHILDEQKLYRPKITWEPAPGNCEALKSYIDAVEFVDIEKLHAN